MTAMRRLKPSTLSLCIGLALAVSSPASALARKLPTKAMAGASQAVTPDILDAVAREMERAASYLKIPGAPGPYFISYKMTEVEVNDAVASLGARTSNRNRHFVNLEARVHVGSYEFDNTNYVVADSEATDGVATFTLPLEATPRIARRAAWLVTDAAYKEALEQLRAKTDARKSGTVRGNADIPSHSKAEPFVQEDPVAVAELDSLEDLDVRAKRISAEFRAMPHIREGRVAFTSFLERRWYLNTEGTSAHDTRRVTGVIIAATTQAPDGQELVQYYTNYGITADQLPTDADLIAHARRLGKELEDLRKAPIVERFTGPVLFEGTAATDIARHTLAPHLGGTPVPEGLTANEAKQFGGELADRLGLRAISPLLSVVDDPTILTTGKEPLIGGYKFDDEGVPSTRVEVIKDGSLLTLLSSRTPAAKDAKSNGHARRAAPGGVFHGSTTNLFLIPNKGQSRSQLKASLIKEIKAQGVPSGLIIRQLDDAAITATPELVKRELLNMLRTLDPSAPPPAVRAYRVDAKGKEELVRGVQLKPVPIRAWRDLIAVGKTTTLANFLASTESDLAHRITGVNEGAVPSAGIESAISAPDLLFKELDVVSNVIGQRAAPPVSAPGQ